VRAATSALDRRPIRKLQCVSNMVVEYDDRNPAVRHQQTPDEVMEPDPPRGAGSDSPRPPAYGST